MDDAEEKIVNEVIQQMKDYMQNMCDSWNEYDRKATLESSRPIVDYNQWGMCGGYGGQLMSWDTFDYYMKIALSRLRGYYITKDMLTTFSLKNNCLPVVLVSLIQSYS